jgi:hypothetical protein
MYDQLINKSKQPLSIIWVSLYVKTIYFNIDINFNILDFTQHEI